MSRPQSPTHAGLPRIVTDETLNESPTETENLIFKDEPDPATQLATKRAKKIFEKYFKPKPIKHDKVHVLSLSWAPEIDDMGVGDEVAKLDAVFRDDFGYDTQIHTLKQKTEVMVKVSTFVHNFDAPGTLLIIYYAGHGYYDEKTKRLMMTGKAAQMSDVERKRSSTAWNSVEATLEDIEADVLVIFDCCDAGNLAQPVGRASPNRTFEYLAAGGVDQIAARPGKHSFTAALIHCLKELRKDNRPFNTVQLLKAIKQSRIMKEDQEPQLMARFGPWDDNVWIAPLNRPGELSNQGHLQLEHEYLELRLFCYKALTDLDVQRIASRLSDLVNVEDDEHDKFPVRNITLMKKQAHRVNVERYVKRWSHLTRSRRASSVSTTDPPSASLTKFNIENRAFNDQLLSPNHRSSIDCDDDISDVASDITLVQQRVRKDGRPALTKLALHQEVHVALSKDAHGHDHHAKPRLRHLTVLWMKCLFERICDTIMAFSGLLFLLSLSPVRATPLASGIDLPEPFLGRW